MSCYYVSSQLNEIVNQTTISTLHINCVDSFVIYDKMKVKLVTCDCSRVTNTDTSKLIIVFKTLYICKYHSYMHLLFCKT